MENFELERFRSYRTATIINLIICILQSLILYFSYSLTLVGDMAHSFTDGIVLFGTCFASYQATYLLAIKTDAIEERMTRISIILLWAFAPFICWEAWERIRSPVQFLGWPLIAIALISMVGNMWMHHIIHNIGIEKHNHLDRANLLHILGDIAFSGAVLLSALLVLIFHTTAWDGYIALVITFGLSWRGWTIWKELTRLQNNRKTGRLDHDCGHHH